MASAKLMDIVMVHWVDSCEPQPNSEIEQQDIPGVQDIIAASTSAAIGKGNSPSPAIVQSVPTRHRIGNGRSGTTGAGSGGGCCASRACVDKKRFTVFFEAGMVRSRWYRVNA